MVCLQPFGSIVSYAMWVYLLIYPPICITLCFILYHVVFIKKSYICVNKYLLIILTIKVITQKSSQISYKLIYLLRKRSITLFIRHIPKRIQKKMRNLSTISLCPTKFDIFFLLLHFAMETLVHMASKQYHALMEKIKLTKHITLI